MLNKNDEKTTVSIDAQYKYTGYTQPLRDDYAKRNCRLSPCKKSKALARYETIKYLGRYEYFHSFHAQVNSL